MKIQTIINALEMYVASTECSEDERKDAYDSIVHCTQVANNYDGRKLWKDEAHLVTSDTMSTILNHMTYNILGKLLRTYSDDTRDDMFLRYVEECRHQLFGDLSLGSLQLGFDIVYDLWHDNEREGYNKKDGTFGNDEDDSHNKAVVKVPSTPPNIKIVSTLTNSLYYLDAYFITNRDVLEADDYVRVDATRSNLIELLQQYINTRVIL